jgi:parallel beta-helix repeat protein
VLKNNVMLNNTYNLFVWVSDTGLSSWVQDIDTSNTVDEKLVYYLVNKEGLTIDPSSCPNIGYLAVVNSTNIVVRNLNMSKNGTGVQFAYTDNSIITNTTASSDFYGINLEHSENITVKDCLMTQNGWGDLRIEDCYGGGKVYQNSVVANPNGWSLYGDGLSGFTIYHNLFNSSGIPPQGDSSNNFDNGYPSGGNYWKTKEVTDIYSGPFQNETGSDGICDTSFLLSWGGEDGFPLANAIIRDIAIANVTVSPNEVQAGEDVNVTVVVENQGSLTNRFNETFNVTVYYDNTPIETKTVSDLAPGDNTALDFTWDTKYVADGNYTIKARASVFAPESETSDNTYMNGYVRVHQSTRYMQNAKWDSTYWKQLWNNTSAYTSQVCTMPGLISKGYLGVKAYKGATCISGSSVIQVGCWLAGQAGMKSTTWSCSEQNVTDTYLKVEIWYRFQGHSWTSMNVAFKTETFTENTILNTTTWTICLYGCLSQFNPLSFPPLEKTHIMFFWGSSSWESRIEDIIFTNNA